MGNQTTRRVLVIEDSAQISQRLEADLGPDCCVICDRSEIAQTLTGVAVTEVAGLAVIDCDLEEGPPFSLIEALYKLGVPFLTISCRKDALSSRIPNVSWLRKNDMSKAASKAVKALLKVRQRKAGPQPSSAEMIIPSRKV